MEQQVNLVFEEAIIRSKDDQVNYRIVEVFIDAAISGQTDICFEFRRLDVKIKRGEFSFVIIKDVARAFRHGLFFAIFFESCNQVGCEVMFKGLPMNPNDPNDVLRLRMLAAFADYEARNTSKRVRENVYSAMVYNGKFNSQNSWV
ncbi:MAG: recombinase family protein [Bdellovibrionales bacterium]|nr:recombinase family protein [Bdellovibrionales bacterium]